MNLKVDITKLTESPYSDKTKDAFLFDDDELLNSILLEIRNARPSSFLISGYRGVGKTSFVNRVSQQIKTDSICAKLNLAKYEGYPRLVKKLIRQLYISYEAFNTESKATDKALANEFKLLYDRTFHDIVNSRINISKEESKFSSEAEIDLKHILVPLSLFTLSVLNISGAFLSVTGLNWIATFLTGLWLILKSWKLVASNSKSASNSDELSTKSLYDDEIAEHHLLDILQRLNANNISVMISFDEIDKLQDVNGAIKIMDDLKPLLLSGFANFFIVAGQSLYYEYERSMLKENEVISTLFSRVIHIPFLKNATLKNYCLNLLKDSDLKTDYTVNDYLDAVILSSSRIPRKLVNQIRSKLVWTESIPFLDTTENERQHYTFEAKLLRCLTDIMDNQLPLIVQNKVQLDFFIAQLFLWLAKMRTSEGVPFLMSKIIDSEKYVYVPETYLSQLWPLGEILTEKLLENRFLKRQRADDGEREDSFIWLPNASLDGQINPTEQGSISDAPEDEQAYLNFDNSFITDFARLESLARKIWMEVTGKVEQRPTQSFKMIVNDLVNEGVLTRSWYSSVKIDDILTIRNEIVHGTISEADGIRKIQGAEFNLNRLRAEIIENYVFYTCKRTFGEFNFGKDNRGGFDFVAFQPKLTLTFDVKYLQSTLPSTGDYKQLFEKFKTFRDITNQNCYYFLICFKAASGKDNIFYNKVNETLEQHYPDLKPFVEIIYLMEEAISGIGPSLSESLFEISEKLPSSEGDLTSFHTGEEEGRINENIKLGAFSAWPSDFEMQLNYEDSQKAALKELRKLNHLDLGEAQFNIIAKKAKSDWPTDYQMQLHTFKEQSEALYKIRNLKAQPLSEVEFNQILARASQKWPSDYIMTLHDFETQKQALILLKNLKADGVDPKLLQQLKTTAIAEWPEDYEMQLNKLQTQISSYKKLKEG